MKNLYKSNQKSLPDECRITRFACILLSISFDEISEVCNFLKNDMSLVETRRLLMGYLSINSMKHMIFFIVKPVIRGSAQVNLLNAISWDEQFELVCTYLKSACFLFELKILFLTVKAIFCYQEGYFSAEKFKGDPQ